MTLESSLFWEESVLFAKVDATSGGWSGDYIKEDSIGFE